MKRERVNGQSTRSDDVFRSLGSTFRNCVDSPCRAAVLRGMTYGQPCPILLATRGPAQAAFSPFWRAKTAEGEVGEAEVFQLIEAELAQLRCQGCRIDVAEPSFVDPRAGCDCDTPGIATAIVQRRSGFRRPPFWRAACT